VDDDVGIASDPGVECVVLQVRRVQVLPVKFVDLVLPDYTLEVVHREEVRVVPGWRLEGHRKTGV
jgi:hypothetical protein